MAMQSCKSCGNQFESQREGQTMCPTYENRGREERKPAQKDKE